MPPRVFCEKSAEVVENKGRESEKERKERSRVRKRKELKEIEEIKGENPARFVRDNTRNGNMDSICLSIVNLSSTLRRAYGGQAALLAVSARLAVHGFPALAHDDGCQAQSRYWIRPVILPNCIDDQPRQSNPGHVAEVFKEEFAERHAESVPRVGGDLMLAACRTYGAREYFFAKRTQPLRAAGWANLCRTYGPPEKSACCPSAQGKRLAGAHDRFAQKARGTHLPEQPTGV